MSDIVERLDGFSYGSTDGSIMREAAAEIIRLRERVAELEGALNSLLDGVLVNVPVDRFEYNVIRDARATLGRKG